jgi:bifunctional non-homologous end joining protein LigD
MACCGTVASRAVSPCDREAGGGRREAGLEGRPVAIKRYPKGLEGAGFFQKNAGPAFPAWIRREPIPKRGGGHLDHVVVDEPATLVYLADQGTIEFHPWLSLASDLERPVELILDLDPPTDADVAVVRRATRHVHRLLDELGAPTRLKTSGSAGYHVHVPLEGSATWGQGRELARRLAHALADRHPRELTISHRTAGRAGRVFVDWLRNGYGQTSVAAYSVRARPRAPVATPIEWEELTEVAPQTSTMRNIFRRLGQRDDPWATPSASITVDDLEGRLDELGARPSPATRRR